VGDSIPAQTVATNKTGLYTDVRKYNRLAFVCNTGALAAGKTSAMQLVQATDVDGTAVKDITSFVATHTAGTKSTSVTVLLATVLDTHTLILNGDTYLATAATTSLPNRQFSIAGTDAQSAVLLAANINSAAYGTKNVVATVSTATLTIRSNPLGSCAITVTQGVGATLTFADLGSLTVVTVKADDLDLAGGFYWVAPKVTNSASAISSVDVLAEIGHYPAKNIGQYLSYPLT
jgi:hypothetical protein